jgi:hypothetical protein
MGKKSAHWGQLTNQPDEHSDITGVARPVPVNTGGLRGSYANTTEAATCACGKTFARNKEGVGSDRTSCYACVPATSAEKNA